MYATLSCSIFMMMMRATRAAFTTPAAIHSGAFYDIEPSFVLRSSTLKSVAYWSGTLPVCSQWTTTRYGMGPSGLQRGVCPWGVHRIHAVDMVASAMAALIGTHLRHATVRLCYVKSPRSDAVEIDRAITHSLTRDVDASDSEILASSFQAVTAQSEIKLVVDISPAMACRTWRPSSCRPSHGSASAGTDLVQYAVSEVLPLVSAHPRASEPSRLHICRGRFSMPDRGASTAEPGMVCRAACTPETLVLTIKCRPFMHHPTCPSPSIAS